jgi:hypothetical protein
VALTVVSAGDEGSRKAKHQECRDAASQTPVHIFNGWLPDGGVIRIEETDIGDGQKRWAVRIVEAQLQPAVAADLERRSTARPQDRERRFARASFDRVLPFAAFQIGTECVFEAVLAGASQHV